MVKWGVGAEEDEEGRGGVAVVATRCKVGVLGLRGKGG